MKTRIVISSAILCLLLLAGGSCKNDPPTGTHTCDTCNIDTTHHTSSNDTTSHNFTWTQSTISGEAGLTGCWVFGQNNIYVVGGAVRKFDGSKWKDVSPGDAGGSLSGSLSGFTMFAFSEGDYWLTHSGLVFRVQGGTAQPYQFGLDMGGPLHSSWGTSSSNMYSVGDYGTILHFDGSTWTKMQSGTTKGIGTIWGTSNTNIWASGFNPHTAESVLLHYNGVSWSTIDLSRLGTFGVGANALNSCWVCDSAGHSVIVASGSSFYRETDNGAWRSDSGHVPNSLGSGSFIGLFNVTGNNANDFMGGGDGGLIIHWNGVTFLRFESLYSPNDQTYLTNAMSMKANTACVVGAKSGGSWIAIGQRK